jgi:hypothetical protein
LVCESTAYGITCTNTPLINRFDFIENSFDFVSFYLGYVYLYSFIYVTQPWSLVNIGYFTMTQTVALTFFGIVAGFVMAYTRRWKVSVNSASVSCCTHP